MEGGGVRENGRRQESNLMPHSLALCLSPPPLPPHSLPLALSRPSRPCGAKRGRDGERARMRQGRGDGGREGVMEGGGIPLHYIDTKPTKIELGHPGVGERSTPRTWNPISRRESPPYTPPPRASNRPPPCTKQALELSLAPGGSWEQHSARRNCAERLATK